MLMMHPRYNVTNHAYQRSHCLAVTGMPCALLRHLRQTVNAPNGAQQCKKATAASYRTESTEQRLAMTDCWRDRPLRQATKFYQGKLGEGGKVVPAHLIRLVLSL